MLLLGFEPQTVQSVAQSLCSRHYCGYEAEPYATDETYLLSVSFMPQQKIFKWTPTNTAYPLSVGDPLLAIK